MEDTCQLDLDLIFMVYWL